MGQDKRFFVKVCPRCTETGEDGVLGTNDATVKMNNEFCRGFITWLEEDEDECPFCSTKVKPTSMPVDDFYTLRTVSNYNRELLEAMIALKEKDVIEYELKMSQFRNQAQRIEQTKPKQTEKKITCPKCGSTNIISGTRGFTFTTGFLGSGNYRKVCENCGHKWKPGSLSESFDRAWFGNK